MSEPEVTPTGRIRVAIVGAKGRMGQEAVRAVNDANDMTLVAEIGRGDDLPARLRDARPNVLVELTTPESVLSNTLAALDAGVIPLVGATGLSPDDFQVIRLRCAETRLGCLVAPNFAIGAVLMMRFAADAARYLPDVEIIEMHHEGKKDAPSGTALKTAEMIAHARDKSPSRREVGTLETVSGVRGGKGPGEIPIHSVRLPGFVASQEVIFGGAGQRLSLRHDSIDRASFMPGILMAIRQARTLSGLVYGLENLL